MILRAFIEYIDQAVLTINSAAILNTFTTHHQLQLYLLIIFLQNLIQKLKIKKIY
jgi:glutamate dehydrogenase